MKKKLTVFVTSLLMLLMFIPAAVSADSLSGLTLEKEMRAMIEKGIIKGYGGDDYRPKGEVTREQFAGLLARTLDLPAAASTFTDVNGSTALGPSIGAIQVTGIMTGTKDNRFMPTKAITREEMALTMSRVIKYRNLNAEVRDIIIQDADKFTLTGGLDAAKLLSSIKVMSGGSSTLGPNAYVFKPKDISTRDQVSAVLYRYLQFEEGALVPPGDGDGGNGEPPKVDPNIFQVATIQNGQVVPTTAVYTTYDAAMNAYNSSSSVKVILKNNDVIKMKSGRAFGAANPKNYTSIYSNVGLTNEITYVTHGREMKYVGSGPNYAIVQVAGTTAYAKHNEIDLVPDELVKGKDYYVNSNGMLVHYTYDNLAKGNGGNYTTGPSPSFMTPGVQYYSYDGVNFYNENDQFVGKHYQYFQWKSVRVPTEYTGAELDSYIMERLQNRQNTGLTKYKDATTKSKLIGLGQKAKDLETTHNINAMFIIAVAIHESDYGISAKALACNNLFGIAAYDSSTKLCQRSFETPDKSAEAFITDFMNKNYVNPLGGYPNGAVPGNKTTGVNVKYASDPNWGSKVAGHLYTMDVGLGGREYKKHQLALTVVDDSGINIRNAAFGDVLFRYKQKNHADNGDLGYPLVIVEEAQGSDGHLWYKVYADTNPPTQFGWIRSDLVKKIEY